MSVAVFALAAAGGPLVTAPGTPSVLQLRRKVQRTRICTDTGIGAVVYDHTELKKEPRTGGANSRLTGETLPVSHSSFQNPLRYSLSIAIDLSITYQIYQAILDPQASPRMNKTHRSVARSGAESKLVR